MALAGTDRFTIVRQLGAGGMGIVHEAYDREREMRVALKSLPRRTAADIHLFKQEFRTLADVTHPNLASLYELISSGDQWFFTMELVDGVNFLEYVRPEAWPVAQDTDHRVRSTIGLDETELWIHPRAKSACGPLYLPRLRESLSQLVQGVAALHGAGVLHRDIKPSNVLVAKDGRVVLLDFGLATALDPGLLQQSVEEHVVGTYAYMSPEQAAGLPVTPASDWYSVGVLLYEALTGRRPFMGRSIDVLRDKQHCDPVPPGELESGIPDDLNTLCVQLLRRDVNSRPPVHDVIRRVCNIPARQVSELVSSSRSGEALFVGREPQLEALAKAFATMKAGRLVIVFIHGSSGVGKTALVRHFLEGLVGRGEAVVLAGRCHEREAVPFKAFDPVVDGLSRYLRRLSDLQAASLMPRDVLALARVFPELQRVDAVKRTARLSTEPPDRQELRRRAFAALRELLARLADRTPLVLYIDDLQWGDVDSAALLSAIVRPPDAPPLLLLGCYRRGNAAKSPFLSAFQDSIEATDSTLDRRELAVDVLSPSEARQLVEQLVGEQSCATAEQVERIVLESQGNPFLVRELVKHVHEAGQTADFTNRPGDATLDEMLHVRVARLPELARRLLEVVALAGQGIRQAVAYQAANLGPREGANLNILWSSHLVRSTGPGREDEIETYHDRIREVIVAHLPPDRSKELHLRLALALESFGEPSLEAIAKHFHDADERTKAGEYYAAAAEQARDALAFDRAADLYRLALDIGQTIATKVRLMRTKLAETLANAGRSFEAAQEYMAATEGATELESIELQRRAAVQFLTSGNVEQGLNVLHRVLAAVGISLPTSPRRALMSLLGYRILLRLRGLRFRTRDVKEIPSKELTPIDVCWSASEGLLMIDPILAAHFQSRSLLLALRVGEPCRIARGLACELINEAVRGVTDSKRSLLIRQITDEIAQRQNNPYVNGFISLMVGQAAFFRGHWKVARESLERAETMLRNSSTVVGWELRVAQVQCAWSLISMGEVAELVRRTPWIFREAQERGDIYSLTTVGLSIWPLARLAADDPDSARSILREFSRELPDRGFDLRHVQSLLAEVQIEIYDANGDGAWLAINGHWPNLVKSLHWRVQLTRVLMLQLHARSALAAARFCTAHRTLVESAERDARSLERENAAWAKPLARLIQAAARASRRDLSSAISLLEEAVDGFESVHMALYAAATRYRQGQILGGAGGNELVDAAKLWMISQKIQNPARMTALLAPGFTD